MSFWGGFAKVTNNFVETQVRNTIQAVEQVAVVSAPIVKQVAEQTYKEVENTYKQVENTYKQVERTVSQTYLQIEKQATKEAKEQFQQVTNYLIDQTTTSSSSSTCLLQAQLAFCFGDLRSETLKKLDKEMQVSIGSVLKDLISTNDRSWNNVVNILDRNESIRKVGEPNIRRNELTNEDKAYFKFDGSPSRAVINQVKAWFSDLLNSDDILSKTGINIDELARIVAESGARVDSMYTAVYKNTTKRMKVVEVSIFRYPDLDHPYFQLSRIKINAWNTCNRIGFYQEDKNGIKGKFTTINYRSSTERMKQEALQSAIQEANNFFDD